MQKNQNSTSRPIPLIDYVPAEVKETSGENWRIVFYARKPGTNKMQRFRRRVKKIEGKKARMRYAKRICAEINSKLEQKWSPFVETTAKNEYHLFVDVMDKYMKQVEHKVKDNLMRPDTLRSYTSFSRNILNYLETKGEMGLFTVELTKKFIINFLDHIYYDKKRSGRTVNNYLSFFNMVSEYMIDREYLANNPTLGIAKKKIGLKKREIIPEETRNEIFKYFAAKNQHYLALCLMVYFCFIRRTEISKLKVKHINLQASTVFIPGETAKNRKDGIVTIPKRLKEILIFHLEGANKEDFLFAKTFKPGKDQIAPKKISDEWAKMRTALGIKKTYQFYSLKDSGITQLFLLGVPLIKIRDQARHFDIKITETYTPRNYKCDDTIRDLDFDF